MSGEPRRPYNRSDYNKALVLNAALDPFATVLFAAVVAAGIVIGNVAILLPIAVVLYLAAAVRTYFDEDRANAVLEHERGKRRKGLQRGAGRLDPGTLAQPIGDLLRGALAREARIREAIESAQLPYDDVLGEVEAFITAMEGTARRAQLLYDALVESQPVSVEARLLELRAENDPARAELVDALTGQLKVLYRMETQLQAFYDRMERILVELDTVRGHLVSASASSDAAGQQQLASDVRDLRDEVGALAEGMAEVYEEPR